jgi:hypothetical protein
MLRNKLLALVLATLSLVSISQAQVFEGGLQAGIAGTQVAGDTYSGYNKSGVFAGMWIKLQPSNDISFQTELYYIQKGSRHNPDEKKQDFSFYLMRLGYVEMPFLIQYKLRSKLQLETGLALSVLLHSYENRDYIDLSTDDFSVLNPVFIAGFSYPLGDRFSVHLRLSNSILSIRSSLADGARQRFFDSGQYNDCVLLYLGYKF